MLEVCYKGDNCEVCMLTPILSTSLPELKASLSEGGEAKVMLDKLEAIWTAPAEQAGECVPDASSTHESVE